MAGKDFTPVFERLRAIMASHVGGMVVVQDETGRYHVDTRLVRKDGYVLMFGSVQVRARYVAYHLMPIYMSPDLLGASTALRARMQGKSCFNFTSVDESHMRELETLTRRSFDVFSSEAYPRRLVSTPG